MTHWRRRSDARPCRAGPPRADEAAARLRRVLDPRRQREVERSDREARCCRDRRRDEVHEDVHVAEGEQSEIADGHLAARRHAPNAPCRRSDRQRRTVLEADDLLVQIEIAVLVGQVL